MFEKLGFSILTSRVRTDQRALEALKSGQAPVHADFAEFAPEELAADYMWLVCQKQPTNNLQV